MATALEELRVLQEAEAVADGIWEQVVKWEPFAREVVGGQLTRAVDSIGANLAEAFGRFHYREKLRSPIPNAQSPISNLQFGGHREQ